VFGASKNCGLLLLVILQVGCLNNARFTSLEPSVDHEPSVENQSEIKPQLSVANPSFYLVKPGDTLYSIAFRFGFDYKKLAQANNIDQSYKIYEGQSLVLKEVDLVIKPTQLSKDDEAKNDPKSTTNSVTKVNSQENDSRSAGNAESESRKISWSWPHNGNIVRTYLSGVSDRKGIDLRGRIGDSVLAATNGVVVYAGNGLPGYGNLIILEHPSSLLSAYAFTEQMLVKEKDQVKSGQKIATMGKQGDQPGLHFEIRQNGKPVDPLRFLPKR
jgi:lipoprotein NlpD